MKTSMDRKKTTLGLLVLCSFAFLGWQIYQLVSADITTQAEKPAIHMVAQKHAAQPGENSQAITAQTTKGDSPTPATLAQVQSKTAPTAGTEQAYLDLMHQLELVKMQRRLFDEEASIAAAKERIATLNHHASALSGGNASAFGLGGVAMSNSNSAEYQLTYLDHQGGQWSATLLKDNRYETATLGSQLSDGMHVIAIDGEGLMLEKGDLRERLTFAGLTVLPPPPHAEKAALSTNAESPNTAR